MQHSMVPGFSTKDLQFIIKFHEEFQGQQFAHLAQFLCPAVPGQELGKVARSVQLAIKPCAVHSASDCNAGILSVR